MISTKNYKQIVIGLGEIGKAIKTILSCDGIDKENNKSGIYDVMHVCFPYSDNFIEQVKKYQEIFKPNLTIIHSTVPVGTSKKIGAIHSPVRGKHPDLVGGIMNFVKYFGGEKSEEAAKIFSKLGIIVSSGHTSDTTEALKLWDTAQFGFNIVLEKEIKKFCDKYGLDFDIVYRDANRTYNEGYEKLGNPEFKKYILKHVDGKIGGHCVISNLDLLDSDISDFIKRYNDKI